MSGPLWHLLQTSDSLFPTGAYAHSGGLEGMVTEGWVDDPGATIESARVSTTMPWGVTTVSWTGIAQATRLRIRRPFSMASSSPPTM